MDTMVESHIMQQPPMGEQTTRSVSPAGSRKRAFGEIEGAVADRQKGLEPEPTNSIQAATTPISGESISQPPLNGTSAIEIPPTTTKPPTVPNGAENGLIGSNSTSAGATPAPTPVPTPKTPLSMPSMPNKKVKLSPASLEAKRIEKEIRDRQRAEEKARKEEEKRIREEEKKKRDEEREEERKRKEEEKKKRGEEREEERKKREEKRKAKEEERLAKEEEKRKKEEEKSRKERSQMRLNAFFTKPPTSQTANAGTQSSNTDLKGDSLSNGNEDVDRKSSEPTAVKPISDYQRDFPDFFLQSHTTIAPINHFDRDEDALRHLRAKVDSILSSKSGPDDASTQPPTHFRPTELFHLMPYKRRRGKQRLPSVKEILMRMQGSPSNPVNLTEDQVSPDSNENPKDMLRKISMKTLKFSEDVRPPYQGTFTRRIPDKSALRLSRNPFKREMPGINYDYDSEAEWEEPEEGEDLDSEGEEEMSDDGDEDMEGFLDDADEDQPNPKRKIIVGDLEPTCSGLCWEDASGADTDLSEYRMDIISDLPRFKFPIDPYSTSYWQTTPVKKSNAKPTNTSNSAQNNKPLSDMHPPPLPNNGGGGTTLSLTAWASPKSNLQASKSDPSLANGEDAQTQSSAPNNGKPKRQFPPDQLAELKGIVEGSDLTKTGLIEVVKKRFPKIPKGVLRDTVSEVAIRVGDKEADKKWVLK